MFFFFYRHICIYMYIYCMCLYIITWGFKLFYQLGRCVCFVVLFSLVVLLSIYYVPPSHWYGHLDCLICTILVANIRESLLYVLYIYLFEFVYMCIYATHNLCNDNKSNQFHVFMQEHLIVSISISQFWHFLWKRYIRINALHIYLLSCGGVYSQTTLAKNRNGLKCTCGLIDEFIPEHRGWSRVPGHTETGVPLIWHSKVLGLQQANCWSKTHSREIPHCWIHSANYPAKVH